MITGALGLDLKREWRICSHDRPLYIYRTVGVCRFDRKEGGTRELRPVMHVLDQAFTYGFVATGTRKKKSCSTQSQCKLNRTSRGKEEPTLLKATHLSTKVTGRDGRQPDRPRTVLEVCVVTYVTPPIKFQTDKDKCTSLQTIGLRTHAGSGGILAGLKTPTSSKIARRGALVK